MISRQTRKYVYKGFEWSHFLAFSPFEWNSKARFFTCTTSPWRKFFWYVNIFVLLAFEAFMVSRLLQLSKCNDLQSAKELPLVYLATALILFLICLQAFLIRSCEDMPKVVKMMMDFVGRVEVQGGQGSNRKHVRVCWLFDDWCSLIIVGCYTVEICEIVLLSAIAGFFPRFPMLPTSVAGQPHDLHPAFYVAQVAAVAYITITGIGVLNIICLPVMPILFHGLRMLSDLRVQTDWTWSRFGGLTTMRLVNVYHEQQIVMKWVLIYYTEFVLPSFQWLFVLTAIYSLYGAIVSTGVQSILLSIMSFGSVSSLIIILKLLACHDERSRAALASWKVHSGSKWFQKTIVSLEPIRVSVGGFYYVDSGLVLTTLAIIIDSTVSLLMT